METGVPLDLLEEYFNRLWAKKEQQTNKENAERDRKIADCVNKYTHLAMKIKEMTTKQKEKPPKPSHNSQKQPEFENDDYDDGLSQLINSMYTKSNKNSRGQCRAKDDDEDEEGDGIEVITTGPRKKSEKKTEKKKGK